MQLVTHKDCLTPIAALRPVSLMRILSPRPIEVIDAVEESSVGLDKPEAVSADNDKADRLQGAAVPKRTKRRHAAFRRRLFKVGHMRCCWCGAPTSDSGLNLVLTENCPPCVLMVFNYTVSGLYIVCQGII